MADIDSKACRACGIVQPLEQFHRVYSDAERRNAVCRTCHNKKCMERYHRIKVLRPPSATLECAHCGKEFPRPQPKRHGDPPRSSVKHCSLECRFWSKVDKSAGPDACWPWLSAMNDKRYGRFGLNGRTQQAHRFAYELVNGPIGDSSLFACHKCDNPQCCNPSHIFLGTAMENWDDMRSKGRHWTMDAPLIERLRLMKIGKPRPPEVRAKLSAANKGKERPWAKGVPNGQKGIPKPKQSDAMLAYWARRKAQPPAP